MLALWRIARPKGMLLMMIVPILGWGFAHWDYGMGVTRPSAMAILLLAWALLSAGTMWLNASLDGEEGEALFAERTGRPAHLSLAGYIALAMSIALATLADPRAGILCGACTALAVFYSHPKTAWKATTLLAPLVSAVGYGLLSALAGFSIARVPLTLRSLAAFVLLSLAIYGLAIGAQAFQKNDDARRNYRTFVVAYTPEACVRAARACVLVALATTSGLMVLGVYPRLCLLGLPAFVLADRAMRAWQKMPDGGTARDASRAMMYLLGALAVFVGLAFLDNRLG